MTDRRTPGQRAGLTRDRILAATHQLLQGRGLDGLTMRALAERLEVAPNALYSHVSSKTALLDDVLDDVLAEVETPAGRFDAQKVDAQKVDDPRAGLYDLMASTYRVLLGRPDLVPLYLDRRGARGANARRLGEIMLGLLAQAGVRGPDAGAALRVLIVYTIGFAAFAIQQPMTAELAPQPPPEEMAENFASGLNWLLAGIVPAEGPADATTRAAEDSARSTPLRSSESTERTSGHGRKIAGR